MTFRWRYVWEFVKMLVLGYLTLGAEAVIMVVGLEAVVRVIELAEERGLEGAGVGMLLTAMVLATCGVVAWLQWRFAHGIHTHVKKEHEAMKEGERGQS